MSDSPTGVLLATPIVLSLLAGLLFAQFALWRWAVRRVGGPAQTLRTALNVCLGANLAGGLVAALSTSNTDSIWPGIIAGSFAGWLAMTALGARALRAFAGEASGDLGMKASSILHGVTVPLACAVLVFWQHRQELRVPDGVSAPAFEPVPVSRTSPETKPAGLSQAEQIHNEISRDYQARTGRNYNVDLYLDRLRDSENPKAAGPSTPVPGTVSLPNSSNSKPSTTPDAFTPGGRSNEARFYTASDLGQCMLDNRPRGWVEVDDRHSWDSRKMLYTDLAILKEESGKRVKLGVSLKKAADSNLPVNHDVRRFTERELQSHIEAATIVGHKVDRSGFKQIGSAHFFFVDSSLPGPSSGEYTSLWWGVCGVHLVTIDIAADDIAGFQEGLRLLEEVIGKIKL